MKYKEIKMPTGRPKIAIDYNLVYRMAKRFATQEDIAMICKCSLSRLKYDDEFLTAFNKGKSQVFKNLRVAQYKYAMKGNPQLLIWLGKQYLGQKDPDKTLGQVGDDVGSKLSKIADAISKQDTLEKPTD